MRLRRNERSLVVDERGAYQTEYTIVLVLVALVAAVAIATLTMPLITLAISLQEAITFPVP